MSNAVVQHKPLCNNPDVTESEIAHLSKIVYERGHSFRTGLNAKVQSTS